MPDHPTPVTSRQEARERLPDLTRHELGTALVHLAHSVLQRTDPDDDEALRARAFVAEEVGWSLRGDWTDRLEARDPTWPPEDEGGRCTCPRWGDQPGWDPQCPRHAFDWDERCDDHQPGKSSYGRTERGGIKAVCTDCGAPLELHPDDTPPTFTEGWRDEGGREGAG